ncbi:NC2B [Enterospora canceri]|uniref:NC2B n=1 Tax=Enterospora canceri TaxID=1081671 RepID=A0A1Y1S779_9MICR|nr:NC2B [Enterospora canceri]
MFDEKIEDDCSLPKATVDKLIHSTLASKTLMAKDAREVLRSFSKKILIILAGEANRKCEEEKKKTITIDHLIHSLRKYELERYVDEVEKSTKCYLEYTKHKPSKQNKFKESGLTMEQLHAEQQMLFAQAKKVPTTDGASVDELEIQIDDVQEIQDDKSNLS